MKYTPKLIGEFRGMGKILSLHAPLDEQILAFQKKGIPPPYLSTPEQVAQIRVFKPELDELSDLGSRTSLASIGAKNEPIILYRDSPIMNPLMAAIAVAAHRNRQYLLFSREVYEAAKRIAVPQKGLAPEDRTAHILEGKADDGREILLTPEMDDTKFILRRMASEYFRQFNHPSIPFWDLPFKLPPDKSIINYMWFSTPRLGSILDCRCMHLESECNAFAVLLSQKPAGK